MLNEMDINFYHENGYLIVKSPDFLAFKEEVKVNLREMALIILSKYYSPEIFASVKELSFEEIVNYCVTTEKNNSITKIFYQLFTTCPTFLNSVGHRLFTEISNDLGLIYPIPSTLPLIRIDRPKDNTYLVPSHQDYWYSMNCLTSVTYWFSLVDLFPDLGLLKVVPGSHKFGLLPIKEFSKENPYVLKEEPSQKYIEVNLESDEFLVFSQLLIHKSGNNNSTKTRISVQVRHNDLANLSNLGSSYVVNQSNLTLSLQADWYEKSINL